MIFKWLYNKTHRYSPECFCGWKMKPISNPYYDTWKCIWIKTCGWRVFSGTGSKLHWYKNR